MPPKEPWYVEEKAKRGEDVSIEQAMAKPWYAEEAEIRDKQLIESGLARTEVGVAEESRIRLEQKYGLSVTEDLLRGIGEMEFGLMNAVANSSEMQDKEKRTRFLATVEAFVRGLSMQTFRGKDEPNTRRITEALLAANSVFGTDVEHFVRQRKAIESQP